LRIKCALFVYSHSSEIFLILFKLILTLLHLLHFIILHFYSFLTFPSRKYAILTISKALFTIDADLVLACYSTYVIYQKVGPKFPNHSGTHRWMVHCKMLIYKLHFLLNLCTMIQWLCNYFDAKWNKMFLYQWKLLISEHDNHLLNELLHFHSCVLNW